MMTPQQAQALLDEFHEIILAVKAADTWDEYTSERGFVTPIDLTHLGEYFRRMSLQVVAEVIGDHKEPTDELIKKVRNAEELAFVSALLVGAAIARGELVVPTA